MLVMFKEQFILFYFFHYHLSPLYPLSLAITSLVSVSMSPFSFLLDPSTPYPPTIAAILLFTYESKGQFRR